MRPPPFSRAIRPLLGAATHAAAAAAARLGAKAALALFLVLAALAAVVTSAVFLLRALYRSLMLSYGIEAADLSFGIGFLVIALVLVLVLARRVRRRRRAPTLHEALADAAAGRPTEEGRSMPLGVLAAAFLAGFLLSRTGRD